jgi:hypothetical protein
MNKGLKIALVIGAAIAAFFLLKKTASASEGKSPTGLQKITAGVAGIVATAGKATKVLGEAVGLFGGGAAVVAGSPVAAASIGTTTLVGTNIGFTGASSAASAPVSGAAAGSAGFGATAATVGGFAAAAFVVVSFFKTLFGKHTHIGSPDILKTPVQEDGERQIINLQEVNDISESAGATPTGARIKW